MSTTQPGVVQSMDLILQRISAGQLRYRWIRIEFSQALRGQPTRPLLRFYRAKGPPEEHILPAAVLGRARWIGLAPKDLESLEILIVSGSAEDIRIDKVLAVPELAIARMIATHHPAALPRYLFSLNAGRHSRAVLVRSLLDLSPPERFGSFERTRVRRYEPDGLDAGLPATTSVEPSLCFIVMTEGRYEALDKTLRSLAEQIDSSFRLMLGVTQSEASSRVRHAVKQIHLEEAAEILALEPSLESADRKALDLVCRSSSTWVAKLNAGDILSPEAVLVLRDHIAAHPELQVLYADSIALVGEHKERRPEVKPDWSPSFLEQIDYVGRPCLFRRSLLEQAVGRVDMSDPHPWWAALKLSCRGRRQAEVGHLKRLLVEHERKEVQSQQVSARVRPSAAGRPAGRTTIIIPTRDRVDLLRRAISSIFRHTAVRDDFEILIVDNGSEESETIAYLSAIEDGQIVRVLPHPGPFNYPDLINAGAEAAAGDVLVLLNNDCEARDGAWLDAMTSVATERDVGAVGAILLYQDGRLQHGGVALGLGGEAGHRNRKSPATHPGNLGRLKAVHEVSAVTAACLAVERRKFDQVRGFDRAFAVAFNDIDFCLKLQALGYRNLLTPEAVLIHAESASRGLDSGPKRARFEAEAGLFRDRWRPLIHDDPYFHPIFSITRFSDQLG